MSVTISIRHAVKRYGSVTVIPDLSINIQEGELFTLLGPSGCGKTTLLRMIAGFNSIEGGEFRFNDKVINDMEPGKRDIGMVFQNYAIFPNLSVRKNVEFGLKYKHMSKEDMRQEVDKFLQLVHVDQYADRMPERLSGGQQQRVALARALVIQPDVLLMDEPLSNLDAKLRNQMRAEIIKLRQKINTTFIGKSNLMEASLKAVDGRAVLRFKNGYEVEIPAVREEELRDRSVTVSIRPEELLVQLRQPNADTAGLKATIKDSVFLGPNTHYFVELETGEDVEIIQESEIDSIIPPGREVTLTLKAQKVNLFDPDSTASLMKGVKNSTDLPSVSAGRRDVS